MNDWQMVQSSGPLMKDVWDKLDTAKMFYDNRKYRTFWDYNWGQYKQATSKVKEPITFLDNKRATILRDLGYTIHNLPKYDFDPFKASRQYYIIGSFTDDEIEELIELAL